MNRLEFIIAIAAILFIAFALGWVAHWLLSRFHQVSTADLNELEAMAKALHDAEETRDQAISYLQQREAELTGQLSQTEAELRATMDGLREARQETEELRQYIDRGNLGPD
jgi:septal ring factor EnvC (AmiA/AmiB activator)